MNQLLDSGSHSYEENQQEHDITTHENQIIYSYAAYCEGMKEGGRECLQSIYNSSLLAGTDGGSEYKDTEREARARDIGRVGSTAVVVQVTKPGAVAVWRLRGRVTIQVHCTPSERVHC